MATMMELLKKLYPLRLAPVSKDTDIAVEILLEELPFQVHEYLSLSEHNGWIIPLKWEVKKAEIRKDGKLIYDGMHHPLGVIGYSQSFQGTISLEELKKHLYYHEKWPNALVYHYLLYYRNWEKDWGFSIPYNLYKSLEPGGYEVDLQTVHEPGTMKVCDYFVQGERDEAIVFAAHNCHAGQANDDISGVVVGVELMKRLAQRNTKYSYRLLVGPEQFSSVFYLADLSKHVIGNFKYCVYLETLGNDNRLALQKSFTGDTELDRAAYHYLAHKHPDFHCGEFRQVIGNDETVWEAPGYEVPTISISRANPIAEGLHYPEYHTSMDNADIILESRLEESVEAVLDVCQILETNCFIERKFEGLMALSNPKYDLYIDSMDPAIRQAVPEKQRHWFNLMVRLPRYFDGKTSVLDIAMRHDLPYDEVFYYVCKFREKGLVEFVDMIS